MPPGCLPAAEVYENVEPLQRFGLPDSDRRVLIPIGFTVGPHAGTMTSAYPPGLPLHMAAAGLIGGWTTTPFLVAPILAIACLFKSVVASMQMTGAMRTYTGLTFARWDWIEADRFQVLRGQIEGRGYRWYALLMPFEIEPLRKNLPGHWTEVATLRQVTLFRLEAEGP